MDELGKLVKKFNAKIARIKTRKPELSQYQPEKISLRELRKQLKELPANETKVEINKLKRYLTKGAEDIYTTKKGVNITLWEKKNIDLAFRRINARNKKLIEKYAPSTYKGTMGTIERANLAPRKNTVNEILPKNWDRFKSNLEKRLTFSSESAKAKAYKENYIKAIEDVLGTKSELIRIARALPDMFLYSLYYDNPFLQIDFIYDPREAKEIENRTVMELKRAVEKSALKSAQKTEILKLIG